MDFDSIQKLAETMSTLMVPMASIVLSLYGWKKTGHIDLHKTLSAAGDVAHIVTSSIANDEDEDKAIEKGVDEVEKLRGKKLSKKLRRKAHARIKSLIKSTLAK